MPLGRVCRMILDSTGFEVPSPEEEPSKEKTVVVDVEEPNKQADVDKPVGRPAEKKMPKPEKQKAPETKAMPRPKGPRLNETTDRALKKLEEITEDKEQAVWLDPEDMASRIPKEYCGQGRPRFISTKLSHLLRGHAISNGALSPAFDPIEMGMNFGETMRVLPKYVWSPTINSVGGEEQ